jgi:hypothetical protein
MRGSRFKGRAKARQTVIYIGVQLGADSITLFFGL